MLRATRTFSRTGYASHSTERSSEYGLTAIQRANVWTAVVGPQKNRSFNKRCQQQGTTVISNAFGRSRPTLSKSLITTRPFAASSNPQPTPTPEMYLKVIQNSAFAPSLALEHTKEDKTSPEDRMRRAYSRVFQIILYLGQPREEEAAAKFLLDFEQAPLQSDTEIAKAREAISVLTGTVVRDLTSIPLYSPIRTEHREIFEVFGALMPLYDVYLAQGPDLGQPVWSEFWSKAQQIMMALAAKLDEGGYGLKDGE